MGTQNKKVSARLKRKLRIRQKVKGTTERPRLSVFRSARHVYAQIINDEDGKTIAAASSRESTVSSDPEAKEKKAVATIVGRLVARRGMEKGVTKVVFDRNGYLYHGRVKALSDGAREVGLNF